VTPPDSANAKTVAPFRAKPASTASAAAREDATFEFASETKAGDGGPSDAGRARTALPIAIRRKPGTVALAAVVAVVAIAGAVWGAIALRKQAVVTGVVNVESDPPGAEVRLDDVTQGTTPLSLTVPQGSHALAVRQGTRTKQLNIDVTSGASKAYYVTWGEPEPVAPAAPATGGLSVVSDPSGSAVVVDGTTRGQTPLTIQGLAPGRHDVLVRGASTTYQRSVQVDAGATASLVVGGAAAAAPSFGWIALRTPFTVQVLEAGRVVGTSEIDRILLSPGSHELDFVSDVFGFRQSSRVTITAGRGDAVSLTIPRVPMNINALPWAEVFVDGTRIGDTPLANVMQPIGDHELVFRHPQLGEKRQTARLTTQGESLRVSVDMRAR
jgi:hypothetical protein